MEDLHERQYQEINSRTLAENAEKELRAISELLQQQQHELYKAQGQWNQAMVAMEAERRNVENLEATVRALEAAMNRLP